MILWKRALVASLFFVSIAAGTMGISKERSSSGPEAGRTTMRAMPLPASTRAPASLPARITLRVQEKKQPLAAKALLNVSPADVAELVASVAASEQDPDPGSLLESLRAQGFQVLERRAGDPRTGERTEIEGTPLAGSGSCHAIFDIQTDGSQRFSSLRMNLDSSDFDAVVARAAATLGEGAKVVRKESDVVRWELRNEKALFVKKVKGDDGRERVLLTTEYLIE